jgi:hypothetical protein
MRSHQEILLAVAAPLLAAALIGVFHAAAQSTGRGRNSG